MTTETRVVPTLYDASGDAFCQSITSPSSNTVRAKCILPPHKVIPVIFIPGIMGSNLSNPGDAAKSAGLEDGAAWFPDSNGWGLSFRGLKPDKRQVILDPDQTAVADLADIPDSDNAFFTQAPKSAQENWKAEFRRRGWASVCMGFYSSILYWLEFNLNRMYLDAKISGPWRQLLDTQGRNWGEMKGYVPLTETELLKAADYWYPVHAVGYNWLRSNEEAAKYVSDKISQFKNRYKKLNYTCDQVVLVTHSMGGLVARATAHPEMGNAGDSILGVVHGVQPAIGAATAYKRVRAGSEAGTNPVVAQVLGWSAKEVTAVFAGAPGALQLLPNKLYPKNWLRISRETFLSQPNDILRLPEEDPYKEIYQKKNKWWRLVDPELIDPSGMISSAGKDPWTKYLKNLAVAESFHDKLGDFYHGNSWVHYGADPAQKAWGKVRWATFKDIGFVADDELRYADLGDDDRLGTLVLKLPKDRQGPGRPVAWWNQVIEPPQSAGDGTVPQESGRAPEARVKFIARMSGFDHSSSYQNSAVQALTLYCIAKIVQEAT